jgi:RNA polymerase sigma-70 factor (ECF subfamily)
MVVVRFKPQRTAVTRQGFDAAYLQRLAEGDPQTEQHFCSYFGELIRIKARARHLTQAMAEDVRQETFLRVLRTLRSPGGLRSAESLGAFVNSVCKNVLREGFRDKKRHEPPADEPAPIPDTVTPSPEAQLSSQECKASVRRVLEQMRPQDSRLLCAVLLDERDREEICREFGVTPAYLRVLLHRAKKEFRALYVERDRPWPGGAPDRKPSGAAEGGRLKVARAGGFRRPARKALGL